MGVLSLNLVAEANTAAAAAAQQGQQAGQLSPLGAALAAALEALVPRCLALPLSVDALNRRPWWPRRDQNTQRLVSGPLQMAPNTQARGWVWRERVQLCPPPGRTVQLRLQPSTAACPALPCPAVVVQVVLDETLMAAGTIQEVGLRNMAVRRSGRGTQAAASPGRLPAALPPSGLPAGRHHNTCPSAVSAALCVQALQTLMARQRVAYNFEFFSLDQPADAPVTVLSLGRSLLKDTVDIALPLRPTAPLGERRGQRGGALGCTCTGRWPARLPARRHASRLARALQRTPRAWRRRRPPPTSRRCVPTWRQPVPPTLPLLPTWRCFCSRVSGLGWCAAACCTGGGHGCAVSRT